MTIQQPQEEINKIIIKGKQSEAWFALSKKDKIHTEIFYGGAAGGGKSFLGCLWQLHNRIHYPGTRGMIGRAKLKDLKQSTLQTFWDICKMFNVKAKRDFSYNQQDQVITFVNGSQIFLKDLFYYPSDPEFTSLGSTEYTDAFIDEVQDVTKKAVEMVSSRLRYKFKEFDLTPKLLTTGNPAPGWVRDEWVWFNEQPVKLPKHRTLITALVTDNPDKDFVDNYVQQLSRMSSEYDRRRLLEGDWLAEPAAINPFSFHFSPDHHISDRAYFRPNLPLIISVDFNLNPFAVTFSHFYKDKSGYHDHQFDEASIHNGSIQEMVALINNRYGKYKHQFVLTGDAMGKQRDLGQKDNASYYIQLARGLRISDAQIQVPPNPTHENSRADFNYVLHWSKTPSSRMEYLIHPKCAGSIRDHRMVQCDAYGKIIKAKRTDIDQRADFLDTNRYKVNLFWKKIIIMHQKNSKIS